MSATPNATIEWKYLRSGSGRIHIVCGPLEATYCGWRVVRWTADGADVSQPPHHWEAVAALDDSSGRPCVNCRALAGLLA